MFPHFVVNSLPLWSNSTLLQVTLLLLCTFLTGASTSSLSIVLGFSIVNTVNLFTSDQGVLIASHVMQNPPLPEDKTPLIELHLLMPIDLQSTPPAILR